VVACTYHVVNFHLFDIRLISVGADLPPSLVIGLVAKNHREVRVRQGVVELRVPFIVFDCVRRSRLKQGFGHSRLPIVSIDLTMATRAKPGVDVFIYWIAFRWGACDWCPGFSPGNHNESTHAENEPNHAAEAEPARRLHIGSLHHSFPDGDSAFSGISPVRDLRNLIKSAGALSVFKLR
jgi:hypothetical protein